MGVLKGAEGQQAEGQHAEGKQGEDEKTDANGYKRNEFSREFCYIIVCSGARKGQREMITSKKRITEFAGL